MAYISYFDEVNERWKTASKMTSKLADHDGDLEMRREERRVVRKMDLILMPILTITLGLQVRLDIHEL